MSHRQSFTPGVGITYPTGTNLNTNTIGVYYSQTSSTIQAFNGHPVEVYADGAVWDTILNRYLFPGTEFNVRP